jgi:hypothetical protein
LDLTYFLAFYIKISQAKRSPRWIFHLKYLLIWLNKIDKRGLCRYEVFYLTLVCTMPLELLLDLPSSGGELALIVVALYL